MNVFKFVKMVLLKKMAYVLKTVDKMNQSLLEVIGYSIHQIQIKIIVYEIVLHHLNLNIIRKEIDVNKIVQQKNHFQMDNGQWIEMVFANLIVIEDTKKLRVTFV